MHRISGPNKNHPGNATRSWPIETETGAHNTNMVKIRSLPTETFSPSPTQKPTTLLRVVV